MLTPEICSAMYQCYTSMLAAAQNNDLEALSAHEHTLAQLRMRAVEQHTPIELSRESIETMHAQIARMLEIDAQILEYVGPLLEETRKLLSGSVKDRAVRKAYRSAEF